MNNKTLLITGASGFLGSWLADAAYKKGYRLFGIDLRAPLKPQIWSKFATSSCETADWSELLHGETLDAVCHLAGGASVAASVTDPFADFSSLLPATARLALHMAKFQPSARLFLFSSAAVYGNPQSLPITESTPVHPISPYGVHKATSESLLTHYSRIYNLPTTIFRIFSVYGPGLRKQLIWDVSQKALEAANAGRKSIMLFGTGNESRDFIYVEDLCDAVLAVLNKNNPEACEIYNLASGVESSIAEVAECLVKNLNINLKVSFNGEVRKGDPANWRADVSKLAKADFVPQFSLEQGFKQVAIWAQNPS